MVLHRARTQAEEDFIDSKVKEWREQTGGAFKEEVKLQDKDREPTEEEAEAIKEAQAKQDLEDENKLALDDLER